VSEVGYLELLRDNSPFRRLFLANIISYIGDWFTVIALFILAGEATDNSPIAIAGVLVTRSFGMALCDPFGGMLADRYSRKGLMMLSNFLALLALTSVVAFDLLDSLISYYLLALVMVFAKSLFDPAEYAYLPNICKKNELISANALGSGGWSIALGIGAGIGGFTISEFGITTALWIDCLTFLFSILLISTLPAGGPDNLDKGKLTPKLAINEILDGWKYIQNNPPVKRVVFAKGMWAAGGGAQVFLLILIGMETNFGELAAGIGLLFMVRGFGSGFGPVIAKPLMKNKSVLPYLLGASVGLSGMFYVVVSQVEWTNMLLILIFCSHASSGVNWVYSTTMLQARSDDEWRGRVAGTDFLVITFMMGSSALGAALILENNILELREVIAITGIIQIAIGICWTIFISPSEKRDLMLN
jgi:MFS family permease|tara:strand:- start:5211 stop:6461 length:1251 start_codon:yes stop_codon:yes gene_type:complete